MKYPFPEALQKPRGSRRWTVRNSNSPRVGIKERAMFVPLGDSERERVSRQHEMMHAKISPARVPQIEGIEPMLLQSCEDARVWKRLKERGLAQLQDSHCPETIQEVEQIKAMIKGAPILDAAVCLPSIVALYHSSGVHDEFASKIEHALGSRMYKEDSKGNSVTGQAVLRIIPRLVDQAKLSSFQETVELARQITELIEDAATRMERAKDGPFVADELTARTPLSMSMEKRLGKERTTKRDREADWGKMDVVSAPLTIPLTGALKALARKRARANDCGVVPRRMERFAIDGQIFGAPCKRKQPFTVLIDASGSMNLSEEAVVKLIEKHPRVTVAIYAGMNTTGTLKVVAHGGKRAEKGELYFSFGGNIVDGPALDWLGQRRGRKVWVSDGVVTGKGDAASSETFLDAQEKVRKYGIIRVNDCDRAIELAGVTTWIKPGEWTAA